MKKIIYLIAFWVLNTLFALPIHAQTKDAKTAITALPMYKDTGNPQQDNQRYAADKKAWAEANPNVYNTTTNGGQGLSKPNTAAPTTNNTPTQKINGTENTPTIPLMIPPYNPEQFEKERQKEQAKAAEEEAKKIAKLVIEQPAAVIAPPTKVPTHPVAKGYIEKSASEINKEEPQSNNTSSNAGKVNAFPNNAVPTDIATFPTYINTGNEQADIANYSNAKEAWIATHADEYAKMRLPEKGTAKHFISKQEFDNMPVEKQQYITRNADLYYVGENEIIDLPIHKTDSSTQLPEKHIVTKEDLVKMSAEKLAYVKAHPDVYIFATEEQLNLPQPMEKYKVTKEDLAKISPEKLAYMKAHPEVYDMTEVE